MYFTKPVKKVPVYVYVMLVVTLAYLTIEVPFSVHLIEFMGGNPSIADIDAIEVFGRVLTGCAVAIFVVGALLLPRLKFRFKLLCMLGILLTTVGSIGGTFFALNHIADYLGKSSTPEQRRDAFRTNVVKRQIAQNGVGGIAVTNTNDWLTFVSAIPSLGASADELAQMANVEQSEMLSAEAYRALGSIEAGRKFFFSKMRDVAAEFFVEYEKGMEKYRAVRRDLTNKMNEDWERFNREADKRIGPYRLLTSKEGRAQTARAELRKYGLNFAAHQDPFNRYQFEAVYWSKFSQKINKEFQAASIKEFGVEIEPDLNLYGLLQDVGFQKKIREKFNLPSSSIPLNNNMTDAQFQKLVYEPLAAYNNKLFARAFIAPASKFADGEEFAELGINAVKMTQVPVMAILLSIAGAMLHIYKFSTYLIQVLYGRLKRPMINAGIRHGLGFAVMAISFIGMSMTGNVVTSNAAFAQMKSTGPVAQLMHVAIAIQPDFSKLGRGLGSIGPWNLVASHLPAPVLFTAVKNSSVSPAASADLEVEIVNSAPENIPVPTPRPAR